MNIDAIIDSLSEESAILLDESFSECSIALIDAIKSEHFDLPFWFTNYYHESWEYQFKRYVQGEKEIIQLFRYSFFVDACRLLACLNTVSPLSERAYEKLKRISKTTYCANKRLKKAKITENKFHSIESFYRESLIGFFAIALENKWNKECLYLLKEELFGLNPDEVLDILHLYTYKDGRLDINKQLDCLNKKAQSLDYEVLRSIEQPLYEYIYEHKTKTSLINARIALVLMKDIFCKENKEALNKALEGHISDEKRLRDYIEYFSSPEFMEQLDGMKIEDATEENVFGDFDKVFNLFTFSIYKPYQVKEMDELEIELKLEKLHSVFRNYRDPVDVHGWNLFDIEDIHDVVESLMENRSFSAAVEKTFQFDKNKQRQLLTNFLQDGLFVKKAGLISLPGKKDLELLCDSIIENKEIMRNLLTSEAILSGFALQRKNSSPSDHFNDIYGDFTSFVVGYIKGMERYLKEVLVQCFPSSICDTKDMGVTIKGNYVQFDKPYDELTADDISHKTVKQGRTYGISLTVASSFFCLKHNYLNGNIPKGNELFDSTGENFNDSWIQKVRNGYLHVDPVKTIERALEIRKETSFWLGYCIFNLKQYPLKK